jgi:p-aminobenzoyl-glutamate transporter AbgT
MRKIIILTILLFLPYIGFACDTCEKAQPKILRGITHGAGPESNWDYVIIGITAIIVTICAYITIVKLIKPKEDNKDHIKNAFLN